MQGNVKSTDVVVMWWDYGNWLSDLGNVTSLADNTTTNATQIQNVGFIFMGNENQSMAMLNSYGQNRVKYIAVFEVLQISQASSGSSSYVASPAGYGDEGKWVWMARISGQNKDGLIKAGFMNPATAWTNETTFGASDPTTGRWQWNDQGLNCTVFELMNYAEVDYATHHDHSIKLTRNHRLPRPNNHSTNILPKSLHCWTKHSTRTIRRLNSTHCNLQD